MKQASLLDIEPTVQIILPTVDLPGPIAQPPTGNFGGSPPQRSPISEDNRPPNWNDISFNFGGDNTPPPVANAFQQAATYEFVSLVFPDLDRLKACRSSAKNEAEFARCVLERAMPPGVRIRQDCAEAHATLLAALLCSNDDPRLLQAYLKIEATSRCVRENGESGDPLERCLAKAWLGKHEQALSACTTQSKTIDDLRICLGALHLTDNESPYVRCAASGGSAEDIAACVAREVTGERFPQYVKCAEQSSNTPVGVATCLMDQFAGPDEKAMLTCIGDAPPGVGAAVACISARATGDKERAYLECVNKHGDDKRRLVSCFGQQALGHEERAYLDCALDRPSNISVAGCVGRAYLGSHGQDIAMLRCAVDSDRSPKGIAACLGPKALGEREQALLACVTQHKGTENIGACLGK